MKCSIARPLSLATLKIMHTCVRCSRLASSPARCRHALSLSLSYLFMSPRRLYSQIFLKQARTSPLSRLVYVLSVHQACVLTAYQTRLEQSRVLHTHYSIFITDLSILILKPFLVNLQSYSKACQLSFERKTWHMLTIFSFSFLEASKFLFSWRFYNIHVLKLLDFHFLKLLNFNSWSFYVFWFLAL